ncbi:MAG: Crp/Fnr family transcriptional regulator [Beijerinckiaceae bacterium]
MREAEAKSILAAKGWLASEPKWLSDAIMKCVTLQTYGPGEYTHFAGDESGGMFGVAGGSFGVMIPAAAGEMVLCHVLGTGAWFGLGPILTGGPRSLTYRAMETSHVLQVSQADLSAIARLHPEFYRRIGMLSEGSYYAMAIRVLGDLLIRSGERRVAAVLSRLAGAGAGWGQGELAAIRLSQTDIGQISNTSRDRVNRTLQKFEKAGWITLGYKAIVIRDLNALEAFVQRERQ